MKETEDILKRYYQGKTTLTEEKMLREARQKGAFTNEPLLAYRNKFDELPPQLLPKLQAQLQKRHRRLRAWRTAAASIAALLILIVSIRGLLPRKDSYSLQLSDNLKKERFEEALRTIGNVLEEETPPLQKVVYEDQKLIIAIE